MPTPVDLGRNSGSAGTTLVITTTATANVGDVILVPVAQVSSLASAVVDSAGNIYVSEKSLNVLNVFCARVTTQLVSGSTITITKSNAIGTAAIAYAVPGLTFTAPFTDNFTGSNNDLLTGRTGWTLTGSGGDEAVINASNQLKSTGIGDAGTITHDVGSINQYVQCTALSGFSSSADALCLRVTDRNALYSCDFSTIDGWEIRSAGARIGLQAGTFTAGDVIKFTANGSLLTVYKNGTAVVSTTDSTNLTQTLVGTRCQNVSSVDPIMDNFEAGILGPGFDVTHSSSGTSSTPSDSQTTTNANDIIFGFLSNSGTATISVEGTGFTALTGQTLTNANIDGGYRNEVATGTFNYNPTLSGAVTWNDITISYRIAPAASGDHNFLLLGVGS